jgi:hypothetical protein
MHFALEQMLDSHSEFFVQGEPTLPPFPPPQASRMVERNNIIPILITAVFILLMSLLTFIFA